MKLATYKDGSRDGQLVVVSRDLHTAHFAAGIATRLQQVLDDWNFLSPQLEDLYTTLNQGKARHGFAFDARQCMAPLPRAYQWADGSAYLGHAERLRQARGEALPDWAHAEPMMYQGGSDDFLGPRDEAWFGSAAWGIDFEAELAVITGDVDMGASAEQGLDAIRLLMLANDWSLRELIPPELAKGFGFVQGKPATAFSPVAVTPDELGTDWRGGRLSAQLRVKLNGRTVGQLATGEGMHFHFGQLVAHLAKTRNVRAGSIIGSGTISQGTINPAAGGAAVGGSPGGSKGWACIAEQRAIEIAAQGAATTGWMALGDTVALVVTGRDGHDLFGSIEQRVVGPGMAEPALTGEDAGEDAADVAPIAEPGAAFQDGEPATGPVTADPASADGAAAEPGH